MTNTLDELRGLLDAATPGEASASETEAGQATICVQFSTRYGPGVLFEADWGTRADAALIVFLRNHAEDLLAVARAAEEARNAIRLHNRGLVGTPNHSPGRWPEERRLSDALARLSPPSEEEVDE